jgi:hypothetical protein
MQCYLPRSPLKIQQSLKLVVYSSNLKPDAIFIETVDLMLSVFHKLPFVRPCSI